jgi:hypothetical protein
LQKGYLKILQFQLYDQPDLFAKIKQQQFEVTEYILITVSETLFKWILFLHKQRFFGITHLLFMLTANVCDFCDI